MQELKRIDGDDPILEDGLVIIFTGGSHKKFYIDSEFDDPMTLDDCLEEIGYQGHVLVYVIYEQAMMGKVYKYGNHGDYWELVGATAGYA